MKQGFDITILPPHDKNGNGFLAKMREDDNGEKILTSVQVPHDADVMVVQRPAHQYQAQMVAMLRANGIAVVVDMDDDMSTIDPNNVAYHTYRHRSRSPFSWKYAAECCQVATLVTTTTRALQQRYARHGRGMILDNYVPEAYLRMPQGDTSTFGWAGTTQSHPNDLQVTGTAFQRLIDDGHPFKVVGGHSKVRQAAKLRQDPEYTGGVDLDKWAGVIARELRVATIPLAASAFNTAKSRLKGIESMAVGVPWVASPREEYRRLQRESGCGLLANSPKDWYDQIKRLLTDDVLWKEQSEAGKAYMINQTYQAKAHLWAEAWTRAYEMERGR
jgi:hypothetical protein